MADGDSGSGSPSDWSPQFLCSSSILKMNDKAPLLPEQAEERTQARTDERRLRRNRRLAPLAIFLVLFNLYCTLRLLRIPSRYFSPPVPPLSSEFIKQCKSLLEAPEGTFTDRLSRLTSALATEDGGAVWIAEPGPSTEYFIGAFGPGVWHPSERSFLIAVTPSSGHRANVTLLTPEFEKGRAQLIALPKEVEEVTTWVSWNEDESPYRKLAEHVGGGGRGKIVDAQVRNFIGEGLEAAWGSHSDVGDVKRKVELVRERKDEREVGLLRCANQMTLHGIRKTRSRMHIGITEKQTSRILSEELAKLGLAEGGGLVLFGENAALPHGSGTDRKLGRNDFVLIDSGGKWGGYVADITRTFALPGSKIPKEHLEVWETVRQAQHAPFERLRDSNISSPPLLGSLDVKARGVITTNTAALNPEGGHPSSAASPDYTYMTHRLGHGIGLEGHEAPYLVQGPLGDKAVQTGHVFSLEPGVYIPYVEGRKGLNGVGVRLEDCFVVTADKDGRLGGEWLSGPVSKWGDI